MTPKRLSILFALSGVIAAAVLLTARDDPIGTVWLSADELRSIRIGAGKAEIIAMLGSPRYENPTQIGVPDGTGGRVLVDGSELVFLQQDSPLMTTRLSFWFAGDRLNDIYVKRYFLGVIDYYDAPIYSIDRNGVDSTKDFERIFPRWKPSSD